MDCAHDRVGTVALWVIVSMAFVCLFSSGCKKKRVPAVPKAPLASVYTNRMNDAVYLGALQTNRLEQSLKAGERSVIVTQMLAYSERVKATLPKDADEAALKAALAKDEGWHKLEAQNAKAIEDIQQVLAAAREKVHQRILEENRDRKAVAEGRAKSVDPMMPGK